ncbi:sulfotransferase 1E1-like [Octopus sinensis]|uniref:Sulfotransferase 1E1-like n=1 Tax=Octopus sinensis TaxID=2607531 RepID=A0A6P7S840_9MOLL|nr:sulfotransferase 1E1-like [Octopus sinensis]
MDSKELKDESECTYVQFYGKDGHPMPVYSYKGHSMICVPMIPSALPKVNTIKFRPDDILMYSYPGAGSHWVFEMVNMILKGNCERVSAIKEDLLIEMAPMEILEATESPRFLNSHLPIELLPSELLKGHKIIYMNRNPKAMLVTFYRHLSGAKTFEYNGDISSFFDLFMKGEIPNGDYFKHTREFYSLFKDNPNVLMVTYEGMKADLSKIVSRVAKFLGRTISDQLNKGIVDMCSFDKMKSEKEVVTSYLPEQSFKEGGTFYHSGKVDTWKKWLTVEQSEIMDARIQSELTEQGIILNF